MKKFKVYIIKSKEGYKYTGMTEDMKERMIKHNTGNYSFWTKRGTEWRIIYIEEFETKKEALHREKWLKTGVGRDYIKKLNLQ